jgi:hypothetical protein
MSGNFSPKQESIARRLKNMKIKLLMVPSIIVIVITLLIWVVYPAFTNPIGGDGVKEKTAELKTEREKLASIKGKSETIHALASKLNSSSMSTDKGLVMEFLPDSIKEYEIIDNLNYLVLKEELQGLAISVGQPLNIVPITPSPDLSGDSSGLAAQAEPAPQATTFAVDLTVQGNYDRIKDLFQKIFKLKRYNRVLNLKIEPATDTVKSNNGQITVGPDTLKAAASLEFAFFKESGKFSSASDDSLSKTEFNQQIMDDIAKIKETPMMPFQPAAQKGKPNPFIP